MKLLAAGLASSHDAPGVRAVLPRRLRCQHTVHLSIQRLRGRVPHVCSPQRLRLRRRCAVRGARHEKSQENNVNGWSAEREVRRLTTAASLWLAAVVGVSAGMGREATAILSTLIALVILAGLRVFKPPAPAKAANNE
jgi:hypothetical protein